MAQLTYLKALNWAFLFLEEHAKEREAARFLLLVVNIGRRPNWSCIITMKCRLPNTISIKQT